MFEYIKLAFTEYLIITVIIIYIIIYIYYNWNILKKQNIMDIKTHLECDYENPIIYTGLIIVICLILLGDDNKLQNTQENKPIQSEISKINNLPKLNISPKLSHKMSPNIIQSPKAIKTGGANKYKIINKDIFIQHDKKDMFMDVNI